MNINRGFKSQQTNINSAVIDNVVLCLFVAVALWILQEFFLFLLFIGFIAGSTCQISNTFLNMSLLHVGPAVLIQQHYGWAELSWVKYLISCSKLEEFIMDRSGCGHCLNFWWTLVKKSGILWQKFLYSVSSRKRNIHNNRFKM